MMLDQTSVSAPIAHIFSDAAAPDAPIIGAGLRMPNGKFSAFSCKIENIPKIFKRFQHIGLFEAIAAHVAKRVFADSIKDLWNISHVDNVGVLYSFVNNSSKCDGTLAICSAANMDDASAQSPSY